MLKETESAGGIVLKRQRSHTLIAVVERHRDVEPKWAPVLRQLPKGGCEPFESLEYTAMREVREETGFETRVIGLAGTASWSYKRGETIWHETVTYFFLEPTSNHPGQHDSEFDVVRWIPIRDAISQLSYPEERALIADVITSRSLPAEYLDGIAG